MLNDDEVHDIQFKLTSEVKHPDYKELRLTENKINEIKIA